MPVITRKEAVECFGDIATIARFLDVTENAIRMWPDGIAPRGAAAELAAASDGLLIFDPGAYRGLPRPSALERRARGMIRQASQCRMQGAKLNRAARAKFEQAERLINEAELMLDGGGL